MNKMSYEKHGVFIRNGMDMATAKRNGLVKAQEVTTTNADINKSIEITKRDKTNSISEKLG